MTISRIRPTLLRRAVVILTVAAIVVVMSFAWLAEAIWKRVTDEFGEDIGAAWYGDAK